MIHEIRPGNTSTIACGNGVFRDVTPAREIICDGCGYGLNDDGREMAA